MNELNLNQVNEQYNNCVDNIHQETKQINNIINSIKMATINFQIGLANLESKVKDKRDIEALKVVCSHYITNMEDIEKCSNLINQNIEIINDIKTKRDKIINNKY